jgi:putative pyruvate formate lyase activating enzyme
MVNRFEGGTGFCGMDAGMNIASICIHRGEEPVISGKNGICNIFFSGCNMRCLFCQNHEISRPACSPGSYGDELSVVLGKIARILEQGINAIGFVSPSHMVPQVKLIIKRLNEMGLHPITIYNTNGYDKPETIRSLEGLIDVYLPDFKYVSSGLAAEFSGSRNYPHVALKAIKEMYYQKGSSLRIDDEGRAECGLLIRHLVLPGQVEESKKVLRTIAEELSTGVHISLMSQYHPTADVMNHASLNRPLYKEEYESVVEEMHNLGFRNGWVQDMDSFQNYLPDFTKDHPFE